MEIYNCRFQIYRKTGLFARKSCEGCSYDAINNPKCPSYSPIAVKDFEKIEGRSFVAVSRYPDGFEGVTEVEEKQNEHWRIRNQLKKLEKMVGLK